MATKKTKKYPFIHIALASLWFCLCPHPGLQTLVRETAKFICLCISFSTVLLFWRIKAAAVAYLCHADTDSPDILTYQSHSLLTPCGVNFCKLNLHRLQELCELWLYIHPFNILSPELFWFLAVSPGYGCLTLEWWPMRTWTSCSQCVFKEALG